MSCAQHGDNTIVRLVVLFVCSHLYLIPAALYRSSQVKYIPKVDGRELTRPCCYFWRGGRGMQDHQGFALVQLAGSPRLGQGQSG